MPPVPTTTVYCNVLYCTGRDGGWTGLVVSATVWYGTVRYVGTKGGTGSLWEHCWVTAR